MLHGRPKVMHAAIHRLKPWARINLSSFTSSVSVILSQQQKLRIVWFPRCSLKVWGTGSPRSPESLCVGGLVPAEGPTGSLWNHYTMAGWAGGSRSLEVSPQWDPKPFLPLILSPGCHEVSTIALPWSSALSTRQETMEPSDCGVKLCDQEPKQTCPPLKS
jgi:hypothetical protein